MSDDFNPRPYTETLFRRHILFHDKNSRFLRYDPQSGLWGDAEQILERDLRMNVLNTLEEFLRIHCVKEVLADVRSLSLRNVDFPESPWQLIPLDNGFYNLDSRTFHEHSPEAYFTSKLPVKYNDQAKCPIIDDIFSQLLPPDKVIDLYELIAYCMIRSYSYQKVFFLYGKGANGKSVFTAILERLIGQSNISHVSLTDFQRNRFAGAELHNKFANVCGELDYQDLNKTDVLKQLTGGDSLKVERKFQHPFNFRNTAKLIFVTNEIPKTTDKTAAFYRRVKLIHFKNVFDGEKADRSLLDKITKEEIEGLAYKCIEFARKMKENGMAFTNDETMESMKEVYEKVSNPFDVFISEIYDEDHDAAIPKTEFKERLTKWFEKHGCRVWDDKLIKKTMEERGFGEQKKKMGNVRANCWIGLKEKQLT